MSWSSEIAANLLDPICCWQSIKDDCIQFSLNLSISLRYCLSLFYFPAWANIIKDLSECVYQYANFFLSFYYTINCLCFYSWITREFWLLVSNKHVEEKIIKEAYLLWTPAFIFSKKRVKFFIWCHAARHIFVSCFDFFLSLNCFTLKFTYSWVKFSGFCYTYFSVLSCWVDTKCILEKLIDNNIYIYIYFCTTIDNNINVGRKLNTGWRSYIILAFFQVPSVTCT